jgi:diguanylate cyclase (GGDEF)-like protein
MAATRNRSRNLLFLTGLLSVLVTNSGAVWLGYSARISTEVDARRELQNLALTISEQTAQALDSIEIVQKSVVAQLEEISLRNPEKLDELVGSVEMHRTLKDRISGLVQLQSIQIINSSGRLASSSGVWPIPELDVSDRPYFKNLSLDNSADFYFGEPLRNRIGGRKTVYLARKISNKNGGFRGMALAGLDLAYFETFYEAVSLEPGSTISMFRNDGTLLARYPRLQHDVPAAVVGLSPLFFGILSRLDHGTVRQVSPIDGVDRFVAARKLRRHPVAIAVSAEADRVLSRWRKGMLSLSAATLLLNVLIALAVALGLRQLRDHARSAHMARHDALTGLANRVSLHQWIDDKLTSGIGFSLAIVDLDEFKSVNDVLGHAAGDAFLQKIGVSLRDVVEPDQAAARLGGDEFALIGPSPDMENLCKRVLTVLRQPIEVSGRQLTIGASIGIASAPGDAATADELLRKADMAMYAAKSAGKAGWRHFHNSMERALLERQVLETDLHMAIEAGQLEIFLQPIVKLDNDSVSGFEALLRWRHPTRGLVSPAEFIPIAESSGLIVPIGAWVLREACRVGAAWCRPLTISVNLSAVQFSSGNLVEVFQHALRDSGLAPSRLEVEVTETVLLKSQETVLETLHSLRRIGIRVALDDFGTGYSSLSYLASFPFDRIKIDRSFVKGMLSDRKSATIVRTTIALATNLGLESTTEGVETVEQLQVLREAGSSAVQGFLFGRPLPVLETAQQFELTRAFGSCTTEIDQICDSPVSANS